MAVDQVAELNELFDEANAAYEEAHRHYLELTNDAELAKTFVESDRVNNPAFRKPSKFKQSQPPQQQSPRPAQPTADGPALIANATQPGAPDRPKRPRIVFKNLPKATGTKRNLAATAFDEEAAVPAAPQPKGIPWTAEQEAAAERAANLDQARLAEQERAERAAAERERQRRIREAPRQHNTNTKRQAAKPPVPKSKRQPRVTGRYNVDRGMKAQRLPVPEIGDFGRLRASVENGTYQPGDENQYKLGLCARINIQARRAAEVANGHLSAEVRRLQTKNVELEEARQRQQQEQQQQQQQQHKRPRIGPYEFRALEHELACAKVALRVQEH